MTGIEAYAKAREGRPVTRRLTINDATSFCVPSERGHVYIWQRGDDTWVQQQVTLDGRPALGQIVHPSTVYLTAQAALDAAIAAGAVIGGDDA